MRIIQICMSIIFTLVLGVGCGHLNQNKMPGVDLTLDKMNKQIRLSAPPEINTFKIGDNLLLVLVNNSDKPIILPSDYGIHIYQYVSSKWELIENRMDYPPGDNMVYPKKAEPFREIVFGVQPLINSDQPVKVRVVVVGNYYNDANGTKGEPVGTYIDVILKPK